MQDAHPGVLGGHKGHTPKSCCPLRSGLVVARLPAEREGPGSNRAADKSLFSRKSLGYAAFGTGCTLTAVPRSTQPSTLQGTVNEYQLYG